jgi:predicted  nucleic acid-binding Zn-ribbon protein
MRPHVSFFDFREVIQSIDGLSERTQIATLKFELFHALDRANDLRAHASELEQRVAELTAENGARTQEHSAFAARLNTELVHATRALASAKSEQDKRVRSLRLELVAAEAHCAALDDMCRSLLIIIEEAASAAPGTKDPEASELSA